MQYVVFAKESKHIKLQKTNNKLPNLFNQDDGNVFFTEVWVVFCLIVIVIALKNVLMALWKQKKQPSLWKKLPQQKSILFVIMLLLSFDSIHQSWQFDSKFLSLEDVYSSGFDVSAVLFGVELGKYFALSVSVSTFF